MAELIRRQTPSVSISALPSLDLADIDEVKFLYGPNHAGTWSDATMFASAGLSALLLINKKTFSRAN